MSISLKILGRLGEGVLTSVPPSFRTNVLPRMVLISTL